MGSMYSAHMAANAAAVYEQAAAMYGGGESHAGISRQQHHPFAQGMTAPGLVGSAAAPPGAAKDEGVEMLKSLFPNTRISVKQMPQPAAGVLKSNAAIAAAQQNAALVA